jgi:GNAT superfamily N-acetyltransferase
MCHKRNVLLPFDPSLLDQIQPPTRPTTASGARSDPVFSPANSDWYPTVGYECTATGTVMQSAATGRVRRNMPDPVPVMVLARLAVDRAYQGRGLGSALLRDALLRTFAASDAAGIRAVLPQAISEDAKRFYLRHGFAESPRCTG